MEEAELNPGQLRRHKLQDLGENLLGQLVEAQGALGARLLVQGASVASVVVAAAAVSEV